MKMLPGFLVLAALSLMVAGCASSDPGYKPHSSKELPKHLEPAKKQEAPRMQVSGANTTYWDGAIELEGFAAYDRGYQGKRPAIVVVHDWMGIG
ncbi:MAG: hypothetical protein KDB07_11845, partial [Planctomycetes bacterium]|nr:hypothetical protein [Planctomycetota bacterium]